MAAADVLAFRPGAVSGGRLSAEEVAARSQTATQAALASLEASPEFASWKRSKRLAAAREAAAGLPWRVWAVLALLMAAGSWGVWRATRPATSVQPIVAPSLEMYDIDIGPPLPADAAPTSAPTSADGWSMEEATVLTQPAQLPGYPYQELASDPEARAALEAALAAAHEEALQVGSAAEAAEQRWRAASEGEAALRLALAEAHEEAQRLAQQLSAERLVSEARLQAAEEAQAALSTALAAAHAEALAAGEAAEEAGAALADTEAQLEAAGARQGSEDAPLLRAQLVKTQAELEAALSAQQAAEAAARQAREDRREAARQLRATATAHVATATRLAAQGRELLAARQERNDFEAAAALAVEGRDAALQTAQEAAAERDAAVQLAAAARRELGEAAAVARQELEERLAGAAARETQLVSELEAARRAALGLSFRQEAEQGSRQAEAAGSPSCSAEQLWRQRPRAVAAAAAGAAAVLVAAAALAAAAGRRRALASAGQGFDSKQLAKLQRALESAQQESESRVAAFKKAQAAADEAQRRLEESKAWEAAAAQLAATTAEGPAAASFRTPLSARSSNQQAALAASPAGNGMAANLTAPAVLPAGKADTPAAWLGLLQQRWAALAGAASRAGAAADEALKEQAWGQEKVSEMLTENELLKERLADAKQAFADASSAEGAARAAASGLQGELDSARQALAAAEAAAMQRAAELEGQLAAVAAERDVLQAEATELRRQLEEVQSELFELGDGVCGLEKENSNLEAQMDQVTQALMEVQSQKGQLERRVAELEQDVASLAVLADKLEGDKAVLEGQLAEAREAQAEVCLASQQLIAADSAIKSYHASEGTEVAQDDLRRAVEEKVLALDLLASAERKLVEQQADSDASSPLPVHQLLLSGRRLSGVASDHSTPRSRGARVASFLGTKLGQMARMLSAGDADGAGDLSPTPSSARSAAGGGAGGGGTPQSIGAWVHRTQALFNSAEQLLGQELTGPDGLPVHATPPRASAASPSGLPRSGSARRREQQAALESALQHSSREVGDLLSALDLAAETVPSSATAADGGAASAQPAAGTAAAAAAVEAAVMAARDALAAAHERVQAAAQRSREAAAEAEELKQRHVGVRQQVAEQEEAVNAAQRRMEEALEDKAAADRGLARAEGELETSPEPRLRAACLEARQAALVAKHGALEAAQAAEVALAAAEEEVEGTVDALCQLEDQIHAAIRRRSAAQDALLQEQAALAAVVQEAAAALEAHAIGAAPGMPTVSPAGSARTLPLSAVQLSTLASPGPDEEEGTAEGALSLGGGTSSGRSSRASGASRASGGAARNSLAFGSPAASPLQQPAACPSPAAVQGLRAAEAEAAAVSQLLEQAWFNGSAAGSALTATSSGRSAPLDRGERAASSKDEQEEAEEAAGNEQEVEQRQPAGQEAGVAEYTIEAREAGRQQRGRRRR